MSTATRLGMTLLIISESIFFFMLVLAFIAFRSQSMKLASETLSLPLALICTGCLLATIFMVWRAARIKESGGAASPRLWFGCAIVLGAGFLVGQSCEYLRLAHRGETIGHDLFGTTFFTLTGIEALQVLLGTLLLFAALRSAVPVGTGQPWPVQRIRAVATYWYFIVAVWVVIFLVVYLWTFL
jgi:heme/copper-type cytochrome/quinol oxidase subunit 3